MTTIGNEKKRMRLAEAFIVMIAESGQELKFNGIKMGGKLFFVSRVAGYAVGMNWLCVASQMFSFLIDACPALVAGSGDWYESATPRGQVIDFHSVSPVLPRHKETNRNRVPRLKIIIIKK